MAQEVVINTCFGGFSVSPKAVEWIRERGYECGDKFVLPGEHYSDGSGPRGDHMDCHGHGVARDAEGLVAAVKELGAGANGSLSDLKVVEVPDGVDWTIDEYDGQESIQEKHRSWK